MFFYFILLFTVLPALELAVLIKVGSYIGVGSTLLIIFSTGIVGAYLARMEGFAVLRNIQDSLAQGRLPTEEMLEGFMILCGGLLLLTPGFITDSLGFFLLIPWTRNIIKLLVRRKIEKMISDADIVTIDTTGREIDQGYEDAEYY